MKLVALVFLAVTAAVFAADPTGKWTAVFDTQIGQQSYTFELKAEGNKLTGKAINKGNGTTEIQDGKVDGDTVSFVENFVYDGNPIRIEYTGKFDGPDRIKFTRKVAEYAVEEIVANRAK
jgi:hypothetical protein